MFYRNFRRFLASLALLAVLACCLNLPSCQSTATGKPIVLCSIFAYYDAARAIGGDKVDVQILLPASASPHDYETTATDKVKAYQASLYIKNGMGLDDRFDKLLNGSKARVVNISDSIPKDMLLKTAEVSLDDKPAQGEAGAAGGEILNNPHIWLDPQIQIKAAEIIRDALIDMDPTDKAAFQANADVYIAKLRKLDQDFTVAARTFKTRDFIGFHSAYDYLAHRYGLRQVASVEEIPDAGLSPDQLVKVINLIKADHIQYIAVETALPANAADAIVRETGVHTIVMQPLETYDNKDNTYDQLMRQNLEALKTALGTKAESQP